MEEIIQYLESKLNEMETNRRLLWQNKMYSTSLGVTKKINKLMEAISFLKDDNY